MKVQKFYIAGSDLLVLTNDGYVSIHQKKVVDIFSYKEVRTPLPHCCKSSDKLETLYATLFRWTNGMSNWLIDFGQRRSWTYALSQIFFDEFGYVYFKRGEVLDDYFNYAINEGVRSYGLYS